MAVVPLPVIVAATDALRDEAAEPVGELAGERSVFAIDMRLIDPAQIRGDRIPLRQTWNEHGDHGRDTTS
jgi:hypothetical protein